MKEFDQKYEDFAETEEFAVDFSKLWNKLLGSWKRIAVWVCAFAVAGLVIGFSIPKRYTVTSRLAPELTNNTVNRLSSLASLAGMNANMLGSTDAVYPMVYPEIVHSVPFLVDLFDMPVDVKDGKETVNTTLYDYCLNYTKRPWWSAVLGLPGRAVGWAKGLLGKESDVAAADSVAIDPFRLSMEQSGVVKAIGGAVEAAVDKKTLVMTVEVTMQDPVVAATLARQVNDNLKKYVTEYRTGKAKHDAAYYEELVESAREEYYTAQRRYASYVDSHQGLVFQSARAEQDRLQNEMNLKFQLYNSVSQQLQQAKAKVQQETPVFAEIIPPTVPLRAAKPSKKKILLAFIVLGAIAGCVDALRRKDEEE